MDVSGKVAVVTGGGRGIGRGIVLAMARNGADVVVADINRKDADGVASEAARMGRESAAVTVDVTDQQSVEDMVAYVTDRFKRIDILGNNAGIIGAPGWEERAENSEDDWDLTLSVNLRGAARVANAVASHMKERQYGKIVNIASVAGRQGSLTSQAYAASKAGVINLTQSMAMELAPFNINVNCICPGLLWTPMWERIAERRRVAPENTEGLTRREIFDLFVKERTPLGREQTPEDIGNAVTFLTSESARNITGQTLNVSGGSHFN